MDDVVIFRRTRGWRAAHVALVGFGVLALCWLTTMFVAAWLIGRGLDPTWFLLGLMIVAIPFARIVLRRVGVQVELHGNGVRMVQGGVSEEWLEWGAIERVRHSSAHIDLIDANGRCLRLDKRFERFPELVSAILLLTESARAAREDLPDVTLPAAFRQPARLYVATLLPVLVGLTLGAFFAAKAFAMACIALLVVCAHMLRSHHRIVIDNSSIRILRPFSAIVVPLRTICDMHLAAAKAQPFIVLQTHAGETVALQPIGNEVIELYDHVRYARSVAARNAEAGRIASTVGATPPRLAFATAGVLLLAYVAVLPIATGAGLRVAALRGDAAGVERMLRFGVPVDARDWSGKTALYEAAKHGRHEVAELLLGAGANPDAPARRTGFTPVHVAAEYDNVEMLQRLLDAGGSVHARSRAGHTPLVQMAWRVGPHEVEIARILLDHGADINAAAAYGWTALHYAAYENNVALLMYLVQRGAVPELRQFKGRTALGAAAAGGHVDAAAALVQLGANLEARDEFGNTPLHIAVLSGHSHVVARLLELGARADVESFEGWTPVQGAALLGHTAVLRVMLAAGVDLQHATASIAPPLHIAAREGHASTVDLLLDAGADPDAMHDGRRAVELARERAHDSVVHALERRTAAARGP